MFSSKLLDIDLFKFLALTVDQRAGGHAHWGHHRFLHHPKLDETHAPLYQTCDW